MRVNQCISVNSHFVNVMFFASPKTIFGPAYLNISRNQGGHIVLPLNISGLIKSTVTFSEIIGKSILVCVFARIYTPPTLILASKILVSKKSQFWSWKIWSKKSLVVGLYSFYLEKNWYFTYSKIESDSEIYCS